MLFLVILVSLALRMVSGLENCDGPHEVPKLLEVLTIPVVNPMTNLVQEAKISISVQSKTPVRMRFYDMNSNSEASEDNEDFKSSIEGSGDRHIFRLHVKLEKGVSNITKVIERIHIGYIFMFSCNSATISILLNELITLNRANVDFPTITEIPRNRYVIEAEGVYVLKTGFSLGSNRKAPDIDHSCYAHLERKNGYLFLRAYSNKKDFKSSTLEHDSGITETICRVEVDKGHESLYVPLRSRVFLSGRSNSNNYIDIQIQVEFRRSGVNMPAIMVWGTHFFVSFGQPSRNQEFEVVPTKDNETYIYCLADAASKPYIAVARLEPGGGYTTLHGLESSSSYYVSLSTSRYKVTSPSRPLEEDEYMCSATSRSGVTSQKFKIVRYTPVTIQADDSVLMVNLDQQFNFSCEATGVPQPDIAFYGSALDMYEDRTLDTATYRKKIQDYELVDTNSFETTTRRGNKKTYGRVIVKNIRSVLDRLPNDYWENNNLYKITCQAFSRFSYTTQVLGYFYKPNDWSSDDRKSATLDRTGLFRRKRYVSSRNHLKFTLN